MLCLVNLFNERIIELKGRKEGWTLEKWFHRKTLEMIRKLSRGKSKVGSWKEQGMFRPVRRRPDGML